MHFAHSFPPIASINAEILILGSIPGRASLSAEQYYAHPRNAFWPIMASILNFNPGAPYTERIQALLSARLALWDVLCSCTRPGSLDADIDSDSSIANDFSSFLSLHPSIKRIYFNGAKAESAFRKQVAPTLHTVEIEFHRLPSTSPAHAALSLEKKLEAWRAIVSE